MRLLLDKAQVIGAIGCRMDCRSRPSLGGKVQTGGTAAVHRPTTAMSRPLNISEAASAAGVSTKMIRHYEQIGLISPAVRTEAGYRQYTVRDVSVLRFIRQARRLDFSMAQIADLLSLWTDRARTSREVKAIAQQHLQTVNERLRDLQDMQAQLQALVEACHGDEQPTCAILDELALPGERGAQPVRLGPPRTKAADARGQASSPQARGNPAADLMAWTRSVAQPTPEDEPPA